MAIYHLQISSISRSTGRSAPAAAAYRAGECLRDERSGTLHNHSARDDVLHKEILLPTSLSGEDMAWARDRASLWNAAEHAERRHDSRVAREYMVALPAELNREQQRLLGQRFARELCERHGIAVDLAIHAPRRAGDVRNYHAHLLTTTRTVRVVGLGAKAGLDMSTAERVRQALVPHLAEFHALRERWALLTNESLREAGLAVRVDHRSLAAQGIDREPLPHIPYAAIQSERRGEYSAVAERIRAQYRARVALRLEREAATHSSERGKGVLSLAQIRQQAREQWRQLRSSGAAPEPASATVSHAPDLAL